MKADVLLGLQWGDEGKGKIVDVLAPGYDIICRFQGGPNAGHTIGFDNHKFILHTIPSGIFYPGKVNVVGNGVLIDPLILLRELNQLQQHGIDVEKRLMVSRKAHLILPSHRLLDAVLESIRGSKKIGSTLKGIGPAYTDKTGRNGLRTGDIASDGFTDRYKALREHHMHIIRSYQTGIPDVRFDGLSFEEYENEWIEALERIKQLNFIDSEYFLNRALDNNRSVLAEGAQGTMLDVDFGTYPYVTSSNTVTAGVCSGLGIPPSRIGSVLGVFKAYCTRVGSGPFPTELDDKDGERLREQGFEFGSTTGRPRRCGWLDLNALRYAIMLNGVSGLIMTKADVMNNFPAIHIATRYLHHGQEIGYLPFESASEKMTPVYRELMGWNTDTCSITSAEQLPEALRQYIRFIEQDTGIPVKMVSVGADRRQIVRTEDRR